MPSDGRQLSPHAALLAFFMLAFAWSWTLWGLSAAIDLPGAIDDAVAIAGRFGPTLSAIALALVMGGRRGLRHLLAPLRRWRAPSLLWAVAVLGPPGVVLAAIALAALFGTAPGTFNDPAGAYLVLPAFVLILVLGGPLAEEIGWRGFALDRLQARTSPLAASLLLGVVWGVWHLPLFLDPDQVQHALPVTIYLGQTTTTAVVYTWLWNRTRSLPVILVLHTMTNLAAGVFPLLPPEAPSDLAFGMAVVLAGIGAVGLIVATRGRLGWTAAPAPERATSAGPLR